MNKLIVAFSLLLPTASAAQGLDAPSAAVGPLHLSSMEAEARTFAARKSHARLLLARDQVSEAFEEATALNRLSPDDIEIYGVLVDAGCALGRYDVAEDAAQWMLNLRPGNVPGLTHAARLRDIFGDAAGALELLDQALQEMSSAEEDERVPILIEMGRLDLAVGNVDVAARTAAEALATAPDSDGALALQASVLSAEGRPGDAAVVLQRRYTAAPRPRALYDLALALEGAGRRDEARAVYARFEAQAKAATAPSEAAELELIAYESGPGDKPAEALAIAKRRFAVRQDVWTRDAYAWALYRNGASVEARSQMEAALAVGSRDARLLLHAGVIADAAGDREGARHLLEAARTTSSPGIAIAAQDALRKMRLERPGGRAPGG